MNIIWILLGIAGLRALRKKKDVPVQVQPAIIPVPEKPSLPEKPEQNVILPSNEKSKVTPKPKVEADVKPIITEEPEENLPPAQNVITPTEKKPIPEYMEPDTYQGAESGTVVPEKTVIPEVSEDIIKQYNIRPPRRSGKFPPRPIGRQYLTQDEVPAYFQVYLKYRGNAEPDALAKEYNKYFSDEGRLEYFLFLNKMKEDYYTGKTPSVNLGVLKPGIYRAPHDIGILHIYASYISYDPGRFFDEKILNLPKLPGWGKATLLDGQTFNIHPNYMFPNLSTDEWNYYQWQAVRKGYLGLFKQYRFYYTVQQLLDHYNGNLAAHGMSNEWRIESL